MPLGGEGGALGWGWRAGRAAAFRATFFTAFLAAGRLRAGARFFAADFFEAFFRAGMESSSVGDHSYCYMKSMTHGARAGKGVQAGEKEP
jgi:hypothetical protein